MVVKLQNHLAGFKLAADGECGRVVDGSDQRYFVPHQQTASIRQIVPGSALGIMRIPHGSHTHTQNQIGVLLVIFR